MFAYMKEHNFSVTTVYRYISKPPADLNTTLHHMNHNRTNRTMCKSINNELKSKDFIGIIKESRKELLEQEQLSLKRSDRNFSDISELSSDTVDYHYRPNEVPPTSICVKKLFKSVYIEKEDLSQNKQNAIFSSPLDDYLRTQKKDHRGGRLYRTCSVKSLAAKASKKNFYKWASSSSANHVDKFRSKHQRSSSQQIAQRLGLIRR